MKKLTFSLGIILASCLVLLSNCNKDEPPPSFTIGGTVSGLAESEYLIVTNGVDELTITEDGAFTFPTPVTDGGSYSVTVTSDPIGQTTSLERGTGTATGGNVTDINITCINILYPIGGTVSGLRESDSIVLVNGIDEVTVTEDGPFTFPTEVDNSGSYEVKVKTNPTGQTSTVENGIGIVNVSEVTNIYVTCTNIPLDTYLIGGTVSGLLGTLVLVNGSEEISITSDGPYYFPTPVANGSNYDIKIKSDPENQQSTLANGKGIIDGANISNVDVTCANLPTNSYLIGGNVAGLESGTLVLANGGEEISITSDGPFSFPTSVDDGGTYDVTIISQPSGGFCSIANGSGTVNGANVSDVAVTCSSTPTYTVGGTISGLTGTLVIANNGVDELTITQNGPFTFTTPLATGSNYEVSIVTQPSGELCSIQNGTGTVDGANVTDVTISCVSNPDIGTNYFAVDDSDPAIFYEFQPDKSLLAKSVNGFGEYSGIVGLAYDIDNDILYAYSNDQQKLLTVNRTTGIATEIADLATSEIYDLAYDKNADKLYAVNFFSGTLFSIDVTTGVMTEVNSNPTLIQVYGLAYDHENDKLYGTSNGKLLEISTTGGGAVTEIGTHIASFNGLAYDTDNDVLFGGTHVEGALLDLYQISSADASTTEIGKTGLPGLFDGGMTYVDGDDQLIASQGLGNGKTYEVDRTSASTTSIGSSGYPWITGLAYSDMDQLVYGLSADPSGINVLLSYNENNGTATFKTEVGLNNGFILLGFTYDDEMDDFYTIVEDGAGEHLASIDRTTGDVAKRLAVLDDNELKALAYDKENNILYGMTTRDLVIINASSGVIIKEIDVDGLSGEVLAMNYDPVNKVLVATTDSRNVIAIDPLTGDSNEITKTDMELYGITFKEQ